VAELPPLVRDLLEPRAYPHHPAKVELLQTQMSFVFLTGEYVYKVKKPVNLGYLDYTTLEKRRHFSEQEVLLNRRLCPDVYLGVVPITQKGGRHGVEGEGKALEYAVKMLQLPQEKMMDRLLAQGRVTPAMAERVARLLAEFHSHAATGPHISAFGSLDYVKTNTEENFTQTEPYIGRTVSSEKYHALKDYAYSFLQRHADIFQQRVEGGHIRDCHGDLHAAHVCFEDGVKVFDCIEFNDRFRYGDTASEVAFLAMDLDRNGFPTLSRAFAEAYVRASGDRGVWDILAFYKFYRAHVRAKVEGFKADAPHMPQEERERALQVARGYFDLALAYTRRKLVITAGMVGTGKTALACGLGERLGWEVVSSDAVRKALASLPPTQHRYEAFETGIYSPAFTRRTYEELFRQGRNILLQGGSVLLDATFRSRALRKEAALLARDAEAQFFVLETVCPEEVIRERLERRAGETSFSDADWQVYLREKEIWEEITEVPRDHHLKVDTRAAVEALLPGLVSRLRGGLEWRKS
jgi:aminoglycoside phosphotransferase family enzyme/predicted kinase